MSYLEHNVKHVPSGLRKVLFLNWPLAVLLTSVASIGFLMLYSVAGGSFSPWAEPQVKRFVLGFALMVGVAMVPIWFWRNMAAVAYALSISLLIGGRVFRRDGHGRAALDRSWILAAPALGVDENCAGDASGGLL